MTEQNTAGFYKASEDNTLLYAPNFVYAPTYTLLKENHSSYEYPVDGWSWFDSEESARQNLNIPAESGEYL